MADPVVAIPTIDRLGRVARTGAGNAGEYLARVGTWNYTRYFDDFLGDTIAGDATTPGLYELTVNNSGTVAILADQPNGVARMTTTGATTDDYALVLLPELPGTGSRNATMAVRLTMASIANIKIEVGFLDLTTRIGVVNALATPTYTATDGVVWIFDTSVDAYWHCRGVKNTTGATVINPAIAPVAATFETLVLELRGDNARFTRLNADSDVTYTSGWMEDAVTETVGLSPFVGVTTRAAAAKTVDIDFIDFWQRRTTGS